MVTDLAPSSGKGVRYGAFHRCGMTAMVVKVLLGVGGFDVDRGAEMTVVNMDIDVQKSEMGGGSVPGEVNGNTDHLSLITTYYPGLCFKRIHREGFHILSSDPSTQDLLTKPPSVTFRKPSNLRQLIVNMSLRPHSTATPTGSRPCSRPRCNTCPIQLLQQLPH